MKIVFIIYQLYLLFLIVLSIPVALYTNCCNYFSIMFSECLPASRTYGTDLNCTETDDYTHCTISCRPGSQITSKLQIHEYYYDLSFMLLVIQQIKKILILLTLNCFRFEEITNDSLVSQTKTDDLLSCKSCAAEELQKKQNCLI